GSERHGGVALVTYHVDKAPFTTQTCWEQLCWREWLLILAISLRSTWREMRSPTAVRAKMRMGHGFMGSYPNIIGSTIFIRATTWTVSNDISIVPVKQSVQLIFDSGSSISSIVLWSLTVARSTIRTKLFPSTFSVLHRQSTPWRSFLMLSRSRSPWPKRLLRGLLSICKLKMAIFTIAIWDGRKSRRKCCTGDKVRCSKPSLTSLARRTGWVVLHNRLASLTNDCCGEGWLYSSYQGVKQSTCRSIWP